MAQQTSAKDLIIEPVFRNNPIALQILGICSALAVTTKLSTSVTMSLAVIAVLATLSAFLPSDRWWAALVQLSSATLVGAAVHLGLASWRKRPELGWAIGRSGTS